MRTIIKEDDIPKKCVECDKTVLQAKNYAGTLMFKCDGCGALMLPGKFKKEDYRGVD